jgi:hypothetical protein
MQTGSGVVRIAGHCVGCVVAQVEQWFGFVVCNLAVMMASNDEVVLFWRHAADTQVRLLCRHLGAL